LGNPEPPLGLDKVRFLLKLNLSYYTKTDLNLLDEIAHWVTLTGHGVMISAKRMLDVVEKYGLRALIIPEQRHIFIDNDIKALKKRFVQAHEIAHSIVPWHRSLLLGDNEISLSPKCYQTMELEANFGARRLMFLGNRFKREVGDSSLNWKSLQALSKKFGNTLTTTLWQAVCDQNPNSPTFGLVGRHPQIPSIGNRGDGENISYFIKSDAFRARFGSVDHQGAFAAVSSYATRQSRGPVGEELCVLNDSNGDPCDFHMASFSNGYDLLTLGYFVGQHKIAVGF
jgi:Zn-dependent peptidase ImmA (M78 family)